MPRIVKDYKNRRRTPVTSGPGVIIEEAKMSGKSGNGALQSNKENMIAHDKAYVDRNNRRPTNPKLRK